MSVSDPVAAQIVAALSGLVRTSRSYAHLRHEQLGATGVTLAVLVRLADGPARPGDLACALGVSASAVSRAVTSLESFGYVTRQPDPSDARAHYLALTDSGAEVLATQRRQHAQLVGGALDGWDDDRARAVLDGIAELDAALARTVAQMRTGGIPTSIAALSPAALATAPDPLLPPDPVVSPSPDPNPKAYA